MPGTIARWILGRSTRRQMLACLALIVSAAPFAIHADEAAMRFDIKAQPLADALMAFGVQTGAIVIASSTLTAGKLSKPVTGQLTLREALTRMLEGTGLEFKMSANGAILIVPAPPPGH